MEHRAGLPRCLAEYRVAVNADIPGLEGLSAGSVDPHANPIGVKGLDESPAVTVRIPAEA